MLLFSMPGGGEFILLTLSFFFIFLIPKILYLITLKSTLESISVENRKMPPNHVWLLFIPLFSLIWHFIVVKNMSDSISAEANLKNLNISEQKPAYNIGLAMCILDCFLIIPGLNLITGIAALICWILYWIKISTYKGMFIGR